VFDIFWFVNHIPNKNVLPQLINPQEQSNCLTRESPIIQRSEALRKNRKALLSELSALVKTAKSLQASFAQVDKASELVDSMILRAFKVVTRAVQFLDIFEHDLRSRLPATKLMATVREERHVPPSPPAETTSFEDAGVMVNSDAATRRSSSGSDISAPKHLDEQVKRRPSTRQSNLETTPVKRRIVNMQRLSVSHRVSVAGPPIFQNPANLISEKLNSHHDTFLSYLGSLIGRLHLQSQASSDISSIVQQSSVAGQDLLAIVEVISHHDSQGGDSLIFSKDILRDCIQGLVVAAQEIMDPSAVEEEVTMPHETNQLKTAATACVKAAGECVAKAKFTIERIGDFEFENQSGGLYIDLVTIARSSSTPNGSQFDARSERTINRSPTVSVISVPREKPLPEIPAKPTTPSKNSHRVPISVQEVLGRVSPTSSNGSRSAISTPTHPRLTNAFISNNGYSPSQASNSHDSEYQASGRSDSIAVSSSGASSTYLSSMRDSESSMLSQTSTRATTPDGVSYLSHHDKYNELDASISSSHSTLDDSEDVEKQMLEKTYAHELLHNKDGQITGGSLPALIERLTTHDSTPDAMFVSTFYLTFRLFATPSQLAHALVDRFEYVGESPHIAGPVRLRVYNVFKGWLESHWRGLSDCEALDIIQAFAHYQLGRTIPAAGKRLVELANKVSSTSCPLVPRLVSSMGKTNTSTALYISPDTPLPSPVLSKSCAGLLKNWKLGGTSPSFTDFDPLELARQFTIKGMNVFCTIMPEELLATEWTKKSGSNAVNVRAMSTLSTDITNLVTDTILQYEEAKRRAGVLKHWIKIAQKCLELNNYDTLMAIISSINTSTIIRLTKTWDHISQKRQEVLKTLREIVEPTKNHAILRQRLHDTVPPCLPFVGTYLTDLTFVDVGNPATRQLATGSDGNRLSVINFDKHTRTAKIIGELQRFQIPYRLQEVPELQEWIQAQIVRVKSSDPMVVQQYYRKSLLLEPREPSKQSPIDVQSAFVLPVSGKEKFFGWAHSGRDRTPS
jgi:hypothetical protein